MEPLHVIAIIPAHNEAKQIAKAIRSVRHQVDQIIVACDRCQDNTFQVARQNGADLVFRTINNHHHKAGALNQALKKYVNWRIPNLYLMVMDADTQIVSNWMKKAARLVNHYSSGENQRYDAVGSVFYSQRGSHPSMLEMCQHNEWVRYANKIKRDQKVFVLTGTCSLISAQKMWAVYERYHHFYDEHSVTEDFAMTVDLKNVKTRMISPLSCICKTRTMKSYTDLIRQRRRWYLGALSLLGHRRWNRVLLPYLGQQLGLLLSVVAFFLFLLTSVVIYWQGDVDITLFWTLAFVIFDSERVLSIWQESVEDRLFAACMIPELIYSLVLQVAYLLALGSLMTRSPLDWNHYKKKER